MPEENRLELALKAVQKLPEDKLADRSIDLIQLMPDEGAKLEVARAIVGRLSPERLRLYLPVMVYKLAGREARLALLEAASSKLSREDVEYLTKMLEWVDRT